MTGIYYSVLFIAGLLTLFRFRKMDVPGRLICALIWLGILTEWAGRYTAGSLTSNVAVYQGSLIAECVLFALYFNYSVPVFRKSGIGYYVGVLLVFLAAVCPGLVEVPDRGNDGFEVFSRLVVLMMAFYAILNRVLRLPLFKRVQHDFHFWIMTVIVFYECLALVSWGLYNTDNQTVVAIQDVLHVLFALNGMAIYAALAILLFLYPRLNRQVWNAT